MLITKINIERENIEINAIIGIERKTLVIK